MTLIDCIHSPSAVAMRAAGVTAVSRYLSWADQRDTLGKVIHQPEYDQLLASGFQVMLNWEYDAQDYLGGAPRGAAHAQEAIRQARALGYPSGCAIYGSADHDVSRSDWLGSGRPYYMAFSSGLRLAGYRAGIYGPWDVLTWAQQDDVADVFWQAGMSTSWSGGRNAQPWPGAHLRQRRQTYIGGQDCDINDILIPNFGAAGGTMTSPLSDMQARQLANADQFWYDTVTEQDTLAGIYAAPDGTPLPLPNLPLQRLKRIEAKLDALAKGVPVSVALTDEDRAALLAGLADIFAKSDAMIGAKLDQLLARLAAAGTALNG